MEFWNVIVGDLIYNQRHCDDVRAKIDMSINVPNENSRNQMLMMSLTQSLYYSKSIMSSSKAKTYFSQIFTRSIVLAKAVVISVTDIHIFQRAYNHSQDNSD